MAGKSFEEYWNSSSNTSFNFEDNSDLDKNVSNANETLESSNSNSVFGLNLEYSNDQTVLPIHSVITKQNLDSVLEDVRMAFQPSLSVEETVKKMFLGFPYVLNLYHSLSQKCELLDEAIASEDGNIILTILLYLKKSLKLNIFYNHISKKKIALQHYINYLKQESKLEELADVYMITGNYSDIIFLYYLGYKNDCDNQSTYIKLTRFFAEHQSNLNSDKSATFIDHKIFLKFQIDTNSSSESVIEQLTVLCKNVNEEDIEGNHIDKKVMNYKDIFKINDFQYEWTLLNTFCTLKMWKKIKSLFIKPYWLSKRNSIKSVINSESFILILHRHNAPKQVLEEFLTCIVDNSLSVALAKKLSCHKFIIDEYITQKDRLAILNYKQNIPYQSEDYFYVENVLHSDRKWKN